MHELQILRDELDVDQAAGCVFEVPRIGVAFLLGNGAAHFDDVGGDGTRVALAAEDFVDHRVDAGGESLRRRHDARARERHVLPGPGLAFLVAFKAADLRRQRTGTARRPQPHIDLIERAVIGVHGQRADQALRQPGEILRAVERPLAVGIRIVVVEIVNHDQIEVGARGHFPGAEPTEREDRGLLAADAAVCGGEILFHFAVHRANEHIGKSRKNLAGLLRRH